MNQEGSPKPKLPLLALGAWTCSLQSMRNTFLWLKAPSLWCFATATCADTPRSLTFVFPVRLSSSIWSRGRECVSHAWDNARTYLVGYLAGCKEKLDLFTPILIGTARAVQNHETPLLAQAWSCPPAEEFQHTWLQKKVKPIYAAPPCQAPQTAIVKC